MSSSDESDMESVPEGEYIVESVTDIKWNETNQQIEYLIRWQGYHEDDDTWEPESNLGNAKDLIIPYESERKKLELKHAAKKKTSVKRKAADSSVSGKQSDTSPVKKKVNKQRSSSDSQSDQDNDQEQKVEKGKKRAFRDMDTSSTVTAPVTTRSNQMEKSYLSESSSSDSDTEKASDKKEIMSDEKKESAQKEKKEKKKRTSSASSSSSSSGKSSHSSDSSSSSDEASKEEFAALAAKLRRDFKETEVKSLSKKTAEASADSSGHKKKTAPAATPATSSSTDNKKKPFDKPVPLSKRKVQKITFEEDDDSVDLFGCRDDDAAAAAVAAGDAADAGKSSSSRTKAKQQPAAEPAIVSRKVSPPPSPQPSPSSSQPSPASGSRSVPAAAAVAKSVTKSEAKVECKPEISAKPGPVIKMEKQPEQRAIENGYVPECILGCAAVCGEVVFLVKFKDLPKSKAELVTLSEVRHDYEQLVINYFQDRLLLVDLDQDDQPVGVPLKSNAGDKDKCIIKATKVAPESPTPSITSPPLLQTISAEPAVADADAAVGGGADEDANVDLGFD